MGGGAYYIGMSYCLRVLRLTNRYNAVLIRHIQMHFNAEFDLV